MNLLAAIFIEACWRDFCAMFGLDPGHLAFRRRHPQPFLLHVGIRGAQFGGGV